MTSKEALQKLRDLAAEHGVIDGIKHAATAMGVKYTTVYGWYRRATVPEWRLPAFSALAEQSSKRKAKK